MGSEGEGAVNAENVSLEVEGQVTCSFTLWTTKLY